MYQRDCAGHLLRHNINAPDDQVLAHFEVGPKTQAARPGDNHKTAYGAPPKRGVKRPAGDDDDDAELN